jgi:hypothetical protein
MNNDEKLILTAWSRGLAGAGARLAKRSWWVLQDSQRRPPGEMVGAWANASEAQAWILNFHTMGVVGLLDAGRTGRPSIHVDAVNHVQEKLQVLTAEGEASRDLRSSLLKRLSQEEKEALWRSVRRSGSRVLRNRGGLDLPVPVPAGLRDLLCVHLGKGVKILAYLPESSRHLDELNGVWLGVPKTRLASDGENVSKYNLVNALSVEVCVRSRIEDQKAVESKAQKREDVLEERVLEHIRKVAETFPGAVVLDLLVDLSEGVLLIRVLQRLRSRKLWSTGLGKNPGNLCTLRIIPYQKTWAAAALMSLASYLSNVEGTLLAELQDQLTLKRSGVFSWVRTADLEKTENASAWLTHELTDDQDA